MRPTRQEWQARSAQHTCATGDDGGRWLSRYPLQPRVWRFGEEHPRSKGGKRQGKRRTLNYGRIKGGKARDPKWDSFWQPEGAAKRTRWPCSPIPQVVPARSACTGRPTHAVARQRPLWTPISAPYGSHVHRSLSAVGHGPWVHGGLGGRGDGAHSQRCRAVPLVREYPGTSTQQSACPHFPIPVPSESAICLKPQIEHTIGSQAPISIRQPWSPSRAHRPVRAGAVKRHAPWETGPK